MMKISIKFNDGTRQTATLPYQGCQHVEVDGTCPSCGTKPWKARGGQPETGYDEYRAQAQCLSCDKIVGTMIVKVSTIFGIEEDDRVLSGRYRVY